MTAKRILSIDGGGIKGAFPAALLAEVEKSLPEPLVRYFDLIAGTSTGGIIALGLGLGFTAGELLNFYATHGPEIFSGNRLRLSLRHWGLAKYSPEPLRRALEGRFGELRVGDSGTRLVIPSMNLETGKVYIYKTAHHPHLSTDYRASAVDAALATASAPTYFPTHYSSNVPLVDGGVWANNPVGMAVVEAVGLLGWPREQLRVLSIGCTQSPFNAGLRSRYGLGKLPWASKVADVFMAGQSSASLGTAYVLAGHENVVRINPTVPEGRFDLDKHQGVRALIGLGESEAREAMPGLRSMFFDRPAEKFEPCYSLP